MIHTLGDCICRSMPQWCEFAADMIPTGIVTVVIVGRVRYNITK